MKDERSILFQHLKKLIKQYEPPFVAKNDSSSRYELWSVKDLEIAGRKRKEVYFAGVIIQSSYVGFYFMPVYAEADLKKVFKKELLATLKGKSCFHINRLDRELISQVRQALETGYRLYRRRGWI